MRGQTDLSSCTKGVNMIENHGENWYKMIQNGQMIDFGGKLDTILGQIMFGTKCDRDKLIFSAEGGGQ